jgi:hypothetical protein
MGMLCMFELDLGNALRSDLEKESTLSIYGLKKNATNA